MALGVGLGLALRVGAQTPVDVLTYHNDPARTGQNLQETTLTLANVNTNTFGRLFSYPVDGYVYAQPLCLSGVPVPGQGVRDLVFVATEHDSVYAFDADDGQRDGGGPVWQDSFINPAAGITSVPVADAGITEPVELGITGTPVIDAASGTLYVVTHTKEVVAGQAAYPHRLHALDVATGAEKFGGPMLINDVSVAQVAPPGSPAFDPLFDFQRPGLALVGGQVYVAFASAGDLGAYHGWVLGFDAHTLQLARVFNDTPTGQEGGIWMSGGAPSVDAQGNLYVMTGNGSFDGTQDFGDSFIKLGTTGTDLAVLDYFTPYDQATLDGEDGDLGSGLPMLLPDGVGSTLHPHLLVGCGKEGTLYLVDRDNMGHFNPTDDSQIVQSLPDVMHGVWGNPAYFNGWIYYQAAGDPLEAFAITNASIDPTPVSVNTNSVWGYPNGTPSISANGTANAIVWLLQTDTFYKQAQAILHAYNATNLQEELYNSAQAGDRDQPGLAQKFSIPVVANGKVYVPGGSLLTVYGTLTEPSFVAQPRDQVVAVGGTVTLAVGVSGAPPFTYQWQFAGADLPEATNATLVLTNLTLDQAGIYSVQVDNPYGGALSGAAQVLVVQPPTLAMGPDQRMVLTGPGGFTCQIESRDGWGAGTDWAPLLQVTVPGEIPSPDNGQVTFSDPAPTPAVRFYRAVVLPPAPMSGF